MAEELIVRGQKVTVIPGAYGDSVVVGLPDRKEDPSLWQSKTLTDADVQKRFHWTTDQLREAVDYLGFPKGTLHRRFRPAEWAFSSYYARPASDVDAWVRRIKNLNV
jgi:hypothetical protein